MDTEHEAQEPPVEGHGTPTPSNSGGGSEHQPGAYFVHVPHPYIARRKQEGPVKLADQLDKSSPMARLNTRVAVLITLGVGSMWCAYLFTLLALVSFPSAIGTRNTIIIVAWIAQTFLQLVLLPVIIVGQNIQGAASDKRAQQTYNDAEAVLHEALQIQQHLSVQDTRLEEIITMLTKAYPAATGEASPSTS